MIYFTPITRNAEAIVKQLPSVYPKTGIILSENQAGSDDTGYLLSGNPLSFLFFMALQRIGILKWKCLSGWNHKQSGQIVRDHFTNFDLLDDLSKFEQLDAEATAFNVIHLDPWRKDRTFDYGLEYTLRGIQKFSDLNDNLKFEIGTEYGRYPMSAKKLEVLLDEVEKAGFKDKIEYVVVQGREGLNLMDPQSAKERIGYLAMQIQICKQRGYKTKQHNQDFITEEAFEEKKQLGLDAINIAPGLARIDNCNAYLHMNAFQRVVAFCKIIANKSARKWINKDNWTFSIKDYICAFNHYTSYKEGPYEVFEAGFIEMYKPLLDVDEKYSN